MEENAVQAQVQAQAAVAPRWNARLTATHWRVLWATFLGWIFDGYETFALIVAIGPALHSLLKPEQLKTLPLWAGTAIGITLLGWGIGGVIGGVLADYIGRKRMMLYAIFLYALFTGLTALSSSYIMLVSLRFLTGLAMGSEWSTGATLLAETWPDEGRPKGAGFMQSGFGWGTFLASVVWFIVNPFGPNAWRWMFVVGIIPAFFIMYIRRTVNESHRWLEAVRSQKWSATGIEEAAAASQRPAQRPFTLTEIFREKESRRRVLLALAMSLATMVGWYAISSWLPGYVTATAKAQHVANPAYWGNVSSMVYNAGSIIGYLISGFLADKIGRRWYLEFLFIGSFVLAPFTYLWTHNVTLLIIVAGINGFFTLGQYAWFAIYLPELFTSTVRATASSFVFNATRLIAFAGPILSATLIQYFGGVSKAAMIFSLIYILGMVVAPFMPETVGKPLPE